MITQTQDIMKQFSLDEYLNNPSRKVVTRDGRNVKIHCSNYDFVGPPIITEIEGLGNEETPHDLFFAPEKHEGWVNIYKAEAPRDTLGCLVTRYVGSSIWPTEEEAKAAADPDPVVTIKIEWEE